MSPKNAFLKWGLLGALVASLLVTGQAQSVGGLSGLLQVGEESSLRQLIESELGQVPTAPLFGHDGQIYYAIALDLQGDVVPPLLDHGGYRYRRIGYPAVASLFGLLNGAQLLYGMVAVAVVATGLAAGLVAALSVRFGRSDWLALAVLANPGVWLSVRLLTSDVLAIALMVLGLHLLVRSSRWSLAAFTASVLTKDIFLATPGGLALSRDRRRWLLLVVPAAALVLWMSWVTISIGDGFTGRENLALPFVGMIDAWPVWRSLDTVEWLYLGFALASVLVGLFYSALRKSWLRWSILGWSILGVVSSNWVWDLGNNAARVFSPIAILIVLAVARPNALDRTNHLP